MEVLNGLNHNKNKMGGGRSEFGDIKNKKGRNRSRLWGMGREDMGARKRTQWIKALAAKNTRVQSLEPTW